MKKNQFKSEPIIGIIGLGYVGLPLAIEFSKKFKTVIGFDKNKKRIIELEEGIDSTNEVDSKALSNSNLQLSSAEESIKNCNVYIITVPTPVDKKNKPDLKPLLSSSKLVGQMLKKNDIIIYESTVFPGATIDYCVPAIEKESNLIYNQNFFCGYSPERINPGDKKRTLTTIKKITAGSTKDVSDYVDSLYSKIIPAGTFKASSIEVAEAAKVIENIQRDVNIALINEFSKIFHKLNLDTLEVLEAAGTKWNFLPFRPGLVGGHCIGVDPYYLTYKALNIGYNPEMILAGREINESMPVYIAKETEKILKIQKKNIKKTKIGVLGLTFKENCPDIRNTKIPIIIGNLKKFGAKVICNDPFADEDLAKNNYQIKIRSLEEFHDLDVIIIAVSHKIYKNFKPNTWKDMIKKDGIIIDIKSLLSKNYFDNSDIYHWRL